MAQLGYTWYPQDWWTSETFYDWEDYPLVRYAYREVLDLLYANKGMAKITNRIIKSRFRINLSEEEFNMLSKKFDITEDDIWTSEKVRIRLSKAESSRENGKLGGRPPKQKKDQNQQKFEEQKKPKNPDLKPDIKTQETHLIKEKEKEKEKEKYKEKKKENNTREENKNFIDDNILPIEVLVEKYLSDKQIVEAVISNEKNNFKNEDHLRQKIEMFKIHLTQNGQHAKSFKDFASHFRYWNLQQSTFEKKQNQNPELRPPKRF